VSLSDQTSAVSDSGAGAANYLLGSLINKVEQSSVAQNKPQFENSNLTLSFFSNRSLNVTYSSYSLGIPTFTDLLSGSIWNL